MTAFARVLMAPRVEDGPLPAPGKADRGDVRKLIPRIHHALIQCSDLVDCKLIFGGKELNAIWLPSGETAGVIFWGRPDAIEAISVLLCGLDEQEDTHAITRATMACAARGWQELAVPEQRPLLVMAFASPQAYTDRVLATAAVAWAVAFFAMLGVGEPELTESPPT